MDDDQCPFSPGWDLQTFGVFSSDMSFVSQDKPLFFSESSTGTGYLEDAVSGWINPFKRRRMLQCPLDQAWDDPEEFVHVHGSPRSITNGPTTTSMSTAKSEQNPTPEQNCPSSPSSSLIRSSLSRDNDEIAPPPASKGPRSSRERSRRKKLAYPFALVKPGGTEGALTLNEINARVLRRPTRPVRHPIGEFACSPCVYPGTPGISGKSVVALTRVHTQGRGTITIIRTSG